MRYSRHAQQQMERRRLTAVEVEEALVNVETSYPGRPEDRTVVLGRTSAGRRLKIVIVDDLVVTAADRDDET